MTGPERAAVPFSGRTAWARNLQTPLREFLRTETGSSVVLLAATVTALVWANVHPTSYGNVWDTQLSIRLGRWGISQDVREWVNNGLMTFFFFVVGLEARREFDMGELRERRRVALPLLAGIGGMVLPVAIYVTANAGLSSAAGWGIAMSTDTAFALGVLALVGPRFPDRLRSFMLTVVVVDDILALVVIAVAYTSRVVWGMLLLALAVFGVIVLVRARRVHVGIVYAALALVAWVAVFESGIDPVVVGLVMGLLAYAYPAARSDLEQTTRLFRRFREQPTPELAASARAGLQLAISPNERLQRLYHPWTSYVIVPLFALANAGVTIDRGLLARAFTSAITLGIVVGYVVGKPVGILGVSWLTTALSRGRLRPSVGWAAVAGGGAVGGIGFTVALLIATLAFRGAELEEAKVGILTAALGASLVGWAVFRLVALLPSRLQIRALMGTEDVIVDLAVPLDADRDHIRGPEKALVTVVEYGDFECPYCGQAEPVVRELLTSDGDVRYAWRHLPLNDVHPHAQLAAEASEAAAAQGLFWEMHDKMLDNQSKLTFGDLLRYAGELGLDTARFEDDLRRHTGAPRIAEDVDSADLSGVSGTPTFFFNGRRQYGVYDIRSLSAAAKAARARATLGGGSISRENA